MKKGHRKNTVGPWAEEKLNALESYLEFYGRALKKQPFKRVYIDAFAGACINKVRDSGTGKKLSPLFLEPKYFFPGQGDAGSQEKFIMGSPVRALGIDNKFHHYYFFDLDRTRAETLRELKAFHRGASVEVGDCNSLIRNLAPSLKRSNIRGVAFLDPYGAHLEWATLEALADTGTMEVIINFPLAMAINRLITNSGVVPDSWSNQLTACFGTEEWRAVAYNCEQTDLWKDENAMVKNEDASRRLLDLYIERLKKLFKHVAKPRLIRNTRKAPLYYLIWAGPHGLGLKGADHILRQGEEVRHI